ncbi:MAG TPA: caspase family protein [Paracoccaceae bacterium]|nr:caspase family protein [Paracoccaceae bacterium]
MLRTGRLRPSSARRALVVAALTAFFLHSGMSAAEAKRLALIVGNSAYSTVPPLKNAARDAQDMAEALKRVGFEVTLLTDVAGADFWDRVDAFADSAEGAESTLFFYSGHAFQMSGVNYLIPVDAQLQSREAVLSETWNLDGIIARIQDRRRQTLIFLDACRNDPLPASVRGSGQADGLARLQTGTGTFVAFATEPGAVTYDGAGDAPNSPFTTALLKNIETPGLSVSDLMIKVRTEVEETTLRRQIPWDQSSLREQFYFKAATETRQELSEADYELLAQLTPEDRAKFIELLRASGFSDESLRKADDAITVASFNLEIVNSTDVVIGVADPTAVVAPVEDAPEIDFAALETVDGGVTVGGAEAAAPAEVVVAEAPVEAPVEEVQVAETPVEAPVEEVVVAEAPVEAPVEEVVVAEAPAEVAPEAPAGDIRFAETSPEEAPEAPLVVAQVPAQPEVLPPVASIPETVVAALPTESGLSPLGVDAPDAGPPVRLAALTWETRGILELAAVADNRTRVEGSEVTPDSDEGRAVLAAIDPRLLDESGITIDESPRELARSAQAELQRLGCYHMKVDGSWGNGSRTALTSYFLAKRQVPDTLEPTAALVQQLRAEGKVVCEVRVAKAVVPGRTKAILPPRETQSQSQRAGQRNPATGRVVATQEQRKTEIKKGLMNPGSF